MKSSFCNNDSNVNTLSIEYAGLNTRNLHQNSVLTQYPDIRHTPHRQRSNNHAHTVKPVYPLFTQFNVHC